MLTRVKNKMKMKESVVESKRRASTESLKTVLVTTVTPFDGSGKVRYDEIANHCEYLVANGMQTVIPCGNTGEFSSLSTEEAKLVTAATAKAVDGRAVVIAGIGGPTATAVELGLAAQEAGAGAVMIHHPTHTYIDRRGLARYYERIVEALDVAVVLYKRGPELEDALIEMLVEDDRVIGVKYAVNDLNAFANLVESSSGDVTWICGTAERWAPFFFLAGATAFSSGLANFAPRKTLELLALLEASDYEEAMRMRSDFVPFEEIRQVDHSAYNVPAVKSAMSFLGLCSPSVREPLRVLEDPELAIVRGCVDAWGTKPIDEVAV